MGEETANRTMGQFVIFIVVVALSASVVYLWYTNEDFRDTVEHIYEKIKNLFGFDTSDDRQIAIDSTKVLSCAIDVTAYWSSHSSDLGTRISYIEDPTQAGAPVNPTLFREVGASDDTQGSWFESCVGDTSGYGVFAPTFSAITTNSGGILGKLSEWSGGGDNKITGHLFEAPEDCKIEGISTCASEHGPDNTYVCDKDADHIVCCEKDLIDKDIYCCDDGYKEMDGQCVKKSAAEIEGDADKIVAANPGTAMRFGRTAVVCKYDELICCHYSSASGVKYLKYGTGSCPLPTVYLIGTVDMSFCDAASPPLAVPERKLQCTVKAFELPQDVDTDIGLIGDVMEFVVQWFSWYGEPKYMIFHETFPEGIDNIWTYEAKDAILTTVAVGGALNVGLGPAKVAVSFVHKSGVSFVKNRALGAALKEGKSAAYQSFVKRYGTSKVLERYILAKTVTALAGKEAAEGVFMNTFRRGVKRNIFSLAGSPELKKLLTVSSTKQTALLDDYGNLIRSEIDIDPALAKRLAYERGIPTDAIDFDDVVSELGALRTLKKGGNLLTDGERGLIETVIKKKVMKDSGVFDKLIKKDLKIAVGKEGKIERMRRFLGLGGRSADLKDDLADRKAEEVTKEAYKDLMRFVYELPGDVADDTTARGAFVSMYSRNWKALYDSEDGSKEVMNELGDRGLLLAKGITGLPADEAFIDVTKRKALLGTVLGLSYVAMLVEFSTEKYGTCGTGSLCMHFPRLLGDLDDITSNNKAFEFEDAVKKTYNDLVMIEVKRLAGTSLMRLALVSPCKTDLTVRTGTCECDKFYGADKIAYKLEKIKCVIDINPDGIVSKKMFKNGVSYEYEPFTTVIAPGVCPATITGTFTYTLNFKSNLDLTLVTATATGTFDVLTAVENNDLVSNISLPNLPRSSDDILSCTQKSDESVEEALERCFNEKIHDASDKIKEEYLECYGGSNRPTIQNCDGASSKNFYNWNYNAPVKILDTRAVPLNLKPNILDNDRLVPISGCTDSWVPDIISTPEKKFCIIVSADKDSMKTYSDNFGRNFCVESKDDAKDWMEVGCNVGTLIASGAIMYFSAGIATPLALYTVGAGGTLCSKVASDAGKWPNDQF